MAGALPKFLQGGRSMSDVQVKITHDAGDGLTPWEAEVYVNGEPALIKGWGRTKLRAIESAQSKFEASLIPPVPEEWLPLYVEPIASRKA
jgi:hypothetical protein